MLSLLKVENFKCFQDHTISFRPLTILAGSNGSGKSSALQAILLLRKAVEVSSSETSYIELNAPEFSLGRASSVLSSMSNSKQIQITGSDENGRLDSYYFDFDDDVSPLSLRVLGKINEDMNFIDYSFRYLGAERIGSRRAYEMNPADTLNLGFRGEFSIHAIEKADITNHTVHPDLLVEKMAKGKFSAQTEAWMQAIFPNIRLNITPYADLNTVTIKYQNMPEGDYYIPTATGFGITYALPVIVAGLLASTERMPILIIENPEAHLHPSGQSRIGQYLAIIASCGVQVIVETHSEHVVDGARIQLAKTEKTELLMINYFYQEHGLVHIKSIESKPTGELLSWPKGFLDQRQQDLKELLRLK